MKILVQFPTRGRINQFALALHRWQSTRSTDNVTFQIVIDRDDTVMNNPKTLASIQQWGNLIIKIIDPCGKIGAINYGLGDISKDYDVIVLASDDMLPNGYGWDRVIIDEMSRYYPDTDGVLWFYDGYRKDLNTLSILGTKYFRRFGYIYHPSYKGLWCDNEFQEVADKLGKQTYFDKCIIKHEHPTWKNRRADALNIRDNNNYIYDERNYRERKASGFGIDIYPYSNPNDQDGDVQPTIGRVESPNPKRRGRRPRTVVQPK